MPGPLESPVLPAHSLASSHAELILDGLIGSRASPHAQGAGASSVREGAGWRVVVIVTPHTASKPKLSECETHCLLLLARLDAPISGVEARKALERLGIGIHGEATVKRAMARLHKLGIVCNSRTGARGYYLEDVAPLVRAAG